MVLSGRKYKPEMPKPIPSRLAHGPTQAACNRTREPIRRLKVHASGSVHND